MRLGSCLPTAKGSKQGLEAIKWYRRAAEVAMRMPSGAIGNIYYDGRGVSQDYTEAVKWLQKAATRVDSEAQFNIAVMYHNGEGVPKDVGAEIKWLLMAAEKGNAKAQFNLANSYNNGQGVPQDYAEALRWYGRSADNGDVRAQLSLGIMYDLGHGAPQGYVQAYKWYDLASEHFRPAKSKTVISRLITVTPRPKKMTPTQIAKAQGLARDWKPNSSLAAENSARYFFQILDDLLIVNLVLRIIRLLPNDLIPEELDRF